MTPLPKEIHDELVDGLSLLIGARLAYAPQTKAKIDETLAAWEVILASRGGWEVDKDKGRVITAFVEMSARLDTFPAPKQLFAYLPPRKAPPPLPKPKAVPCPDEIRAFIDDIVKQLKTDVKPGSKAL